MRAWECVCGRARLPRGPVGEGEELAVELAKLIDVRRAQRRRDGVPGGVRALAALLEQRGAERVAHTLAL